MLPGPRPRAIVALACALCSHAQVQNRAYLPNIANEDWSFLRDRSLVSDFWDPLKYIPLKGEDWYLTLGGEVRIRPEGFRVRSAGGRPGTIDNYLLQRYLFSVGLKMGRRFRFFTELQSGIIDGQLRSPRPTDKDTLDLHQAFFEYTSPKEKNRRLTARLGRQELAIGSNRLISAGQGLNVKRSFDGVYAKYETKDWLVEGGAARLVRLSPGILNDSPDSGQNFWAGAFTKQHFLWKTGSGTVYYLGTDQAIAQYVRGIGPETRSTFGGRLSGAAGNLSFSTDVIGQFGTFLHSEPIRAWAVTTEGGYRFPGKRFRPRLSANFDSASGDKNPNDAALHSFNPLFPGNAFSGLVGLFGPTNITDINASFQMPIRRNLIAIVESPTYFRTEAGDGVYNIQRQLLLGPHGSSEKYIGTNPGLVVTWTVTRHINLTGVITRFFSGPFLEGTFVEKGFGFYSISVTYRF